MHESMPKLLGWDCCLGRHASRRSNREGALTTKRPRCGLPHKVRCFLVSHCSIPRVASQMAASTPTLAGLQPRCHVVAAPPVLPHKRAWTCRSYGIRRALRATPGRFHCIHPLHAFSPGDTSWRQSTKQTVKMLNLWSENGCRQKCLDESLIMLHVTILLL